VDLVGRTSAPSGVTIRDSTFSGGNSDGIQNGGNGVRIVGNTFTGIHQVDGADGVHADAIQLYGSKRTVIQGNHMRDVADGIMAPDGTDHEVIEGNDIATDGYPYAITLGGDRGSVVRGNRLAGGACNYGQPCGTLRIANAKDGSGSSGTTVEDNHLGALAVENGSTLAADSGNVIAP
jgi:nitrous oxidase accessory protein NosD